MPTIPARSFATQRLHAGQSIKIINTLGSQVIDTWAFSTTNPTFPAYMSMIHTRSTLYKLLPSVEEVFLDNRRAPILTMTEDTSPRVHDVLFAACSPERYVLLGASPDHDNCANNLRDAVKACNDPLFDKLAEFLSYGWTPDPLNLFMNVLVQDNTLRLEKPKSRPGDYVVLRAEQDCVVIMSACPMDLSNCNGGPPGSADFQVLH